MTRTSSFGTWLANAYCGLSLSSKAAAVMPPTANFAARSKKSPAVDLAMCVVVVEIQEFLVEFPGSGTFHGVLGLRWD